MEKKIAFLLLAFVLPLAIAAQTPGSLDSLVRSLPRYKIHDTSEIVVPIEQSAVARRVFGFDDAYIDAGSNSTASSFFTDSISKSGFVTQQFTNGNNRNLSQNTVTDLSISAKIKGLNVAAHVVDSDMPVNDDGVTSQISELGSVLITVSADSTYMAVGDTVVMRADTRMANFSKKVRGIDFGSVNMLRNHDTISLRANASATKGRFCRQQFSGINNSQGPYYLRDPNSQLSVVVLVGTERVYLDGAIMQRGPDSDYEIDYNSGTITFNVRHVVSSRNRIVVDFEYSESVFNNYFLYAGAGIHTGSAMVEMGYLSDFDGAGNLDSADIEGLAPQKSDFLYLTAGSRYGQGTSLRVETVAQSRNRNRLMDTAATEKSFGAQIDLLQQLMAGDTARKMELGLSGKYLHESFVPLVTDKDVDFQEKWGLRDYIQGRGERYAGFHSGYRGNAVSINYDAQAADIAETMRGVGQELGATLHRNRLGVSMLLDCFRNRISDISHSYLNGGMDVSYRLDSVKLCVSGSFRKETFGDSVAADYYDLGVSALRNFRRASWRLAYNERGDSRFVTSDIDIHHGENFRMQAIEILRNSHVNNLNSISGRLQGSINLLDNQLNITFSQQQECGNQEQMSFRYIKTSAGNGYFCWNDRNGDGVEDVSEFQVAYYKTDANYVKYFEHTGKYINTLDNSYMVSALIKGRRTSRRISALWDRISLQALCDYKGKSALSGGNAFLKGDSVISSNIHQQYSSRLRILDYLYLGNSLVISRSLHLTYYGPDRNNQESRACFAEMPFSTGLSIKYQYSRKESGYLSDFFADNNYDILSRENMLEAKYETVRGFLYSCEYCNKWRVSLLDQGRALVNSWNVSAMYRNERRGSVMVASKLVSNSSIDEVNLYQLLEGLGKGNNLVTNMSVSYMVGRYLELLLEYEMRASQHLRTIHTGNMQLRLRF